MFESPYENYKINTGKYSQLKNNQCYILTTKRAMYKQLQGNI